MAKGCRATFTPRNSFDRACSVKCAMKIARETPPATLERRARAAARAEKREAREKIMTRADHAKLAQSAFNAWVRARDRYDGCISCHMPATYRGQWHAGHYRTRAAAPQLRFTEDNCHKQCAQCNGSKSGNVVEFRIKLLAKIGPERVEALENDNTSRRYSIDELKEIAKTYRVRTRELRRTHDLGHREHAA
jgi:hypothetical protein